MILGGCFYRCAAFILTVYVLAGPARASIGDNLELFHDCLYGCFKVNCVPGHVPGNPPREYIPFHHRLLRWDCQSNCDYVCQHIVTEKRREDPAILNPVVQYHGKWPFHRFLGAQEPFSVLFSLFNLLAHRNGLSKVLAHIPASYPLRPYYVVFSYIGMASWMFSMIFHTRDFATTEKLDYFAAGASVLYGLYYTPIRIFRLEQKEPPIKQTLLRFWTMICILLYIGHVSYLALWRWDYTYNMAANVAVGVLQNILWSAFSIRTYQKLKKPWAAWPGLIVAWIVMAMSLELLDFPPWWGYVDAHSLWHLGTVGPTIWWYNFLIKDAQQDMAVERLKA